jgi:hypothetical protein
MKLFPEAELEWTNNKVLEIILALKSHITLQTHILNRKSTGCTSLCVISNYFIAIATCFKVILWNEKPQTFIRVKDRLAKRALEQLF